MRIFGHHIHQCQFPWAEAPPWAIELKEMLSLVLRLERRMEIEMDVNFDKMIAAAEKQRGVLNSVKQFCADQKTAMDAISKQLADAIAANDPTAMKAVQDKIDAFAAGFDENDDAIAAAIAAPGTPGTPPPA